MITFSTIGVLSGDPTPVISVRIPSATPVNLWGPVPERDDERVAEISNVEAHFSPAAPTGKSMPLW